MKTLLLIALLFTLLTFGPACNSTTPDADSAPTLPTPDQPSIPEKTATPVQNDDPAKAGQFSMVVKNALLFDADKDPFTRNITQEKGICLLAVGSVRNDSDKIFHRGGVFATLTSDFGNDVIIRKHSGGMGFLPDVSSEAPWRPGDWREFRLITRALDPIYIEYTPSDVEAQIILEVRDPLNFRLRRVLSRFKVDWRPLMGTSVRGTTAFVEQFTPLTLENFAARRFEAGDLVRLTIQKGAGYKVVRDDGTGGWVPFRVISLDLKDFQVRKISKPPVEAQSNGMKLVLEELFAAPAMEKGSQAYTAKLTAVNGHAKQTVHVRTMDFLVDCGPDKAQMGKFIVMEKGLLKKVSSFTLKPQETRKFSFTFQASSDLPLELVWWITSKRRLALPLI